MNSSISSLITYLNAEAARRELPSTGPGAVITVSREEGAGGKPIARLAATLLTARDAAHRPWLVLDDNLAEQIAQDHQLPARIREFLSDEQTSYVTEVVEELLGLHPPRFVLVQHMIETILHLAKIGRAIFVGRAAHIVLMGLPEARHVRLVGALDERAERITALTGLSLDEARAHARRVDRARTRFVGHYFHRDIADPHGYDMVLNTDRISMEQAAELVAGLVSSPAASAPACPCGGKCDRKKIKSEA